MEAGRTARHGHGVRTGPKGPRRIHRLVEPMASRYWASTPGPAATRTRALGRRGKRPRHRPGEQGEVGVQGRVTHGFKALRGAGVAGQRGQVMATWSNGLQDLPWHGDLPWMECRCARRAGAGGGGPFLLSLLLFYLWGSRAFPPEGRGHLGHFLGLLRATVALGYRLPHCLVGDSAPVPAEGCWGLSGSIARLQEPL